MFLPIPNESEAAEFKMTYEIKTGISLADEEAMEMLTSLVQFYYMIGGHEVYANKVAARKGMRAAKTRVATQD